MSRLSQSGETKNESAKSGETRFSVCFDYRCRRGERGYGQDDYSPWLRFGFSLCIHEGPKETHQFRVRHGVCEGGVTAGDPDGQWHYLLANRGHYPFLRTE